MLPDVVFCGLHMWITRDRQTDNQTDKQTETETFRVRKVFAWKRNLIVFPILPMQFKIESYFAILAPLLKRAGVIIINYQLETIVQCLGR